jgi:inosine/xanthosine triphosphate pyrophosphatase family protein
MAEDTGNFSPHQSKSGIIPVKLLIGTKNPAKFNRYQKILQQFPSLQLLSLADLQHIPSVAEDGVTAEENAQKKAITYATAIGISTLSIDESLTIPALPPHEQPGVNVRRYPGFETTDEQLLAIFLEKIKNIPANRRLAIWTYAICLALPDGQALCEQVELIKQLTDRPSLPVTPGYPLSSIMVDIRSGKALRDLTEAEEYQHLLQVYEKVTNMIAATGLV